MDRCHHEYQVEMVGEVFLTGALVCRLCSFREGMSLEQFSRHAKYPRHYQSDGYVEDSVEDRARLAGELYCQRLRDQLQELVSESLQPRLWEEDLNEILTEVIEEALVSEIKSCRDLANDCSLAEGKVLAERIGHRLGGKTRKNQHPHPNQETLRSFRLVP